MHVRDNSSGVTVEGLGLSLPLAVDVGMISGISDNTVVDTSVVHIRGNSGDVSVEGLGLSLPLAVDIGMISGVSNHTVVDNGSDRVHGSVSNDPTIVKSSLSSSVSNVMSGS